MSQTPKWVDFAGSHRHSMAGTSGERGGEKRGNKREVQRDFFIYFLKGRGMLVFLDATAVVSHKKTCRIFYHPHTV